MDHIQDVYAKKPEMIEKIFDHLTKVNLKVDGKPFQVLYNEETDELEYHGRSGNETKVGPMIDDMYRLFSKPINDAIKHIEGRKEVFKKYKFLTFEVISEVLLLTAIITKDGKFIDDPDKIDSIAEELETDVMPCLWKGKISAEQKQTLMEAISTNVIPTKDEFVKWVKALFGTYEKFPKTLISRSSEYIEGIVFFYNVDGKVVEYKLVDPTFRQSVKDNQSNMKADNEANGEKYQQIYEIFVDWAKDNASKLDNSRMKSIELNFIEMMEDPKRYNKLMSLATGLTTITTDAYFLQPDRISDELKKAIQKHGKVYQLLYEKFVRLFWKAKKRNFTISKEFQQDVNKICGMVGESLIVEGDEEHGKIELDNGDIFTYSTNNEQLKNLFDRMKIDEKFRSKIINFGNYQTGDFKTKAIKWLTLKKIDELHAKKALSELKDAAIENNCLSKLIELIDSQFNGTKLKDNKNDGTYFDLLGQIKDNFTEIEILPEINRFLNKYNFDKEFINDIYNITTGPQPEMGRGELLIKMLVYPGNIQKEQSTTKNNDDKDIKGDIYCDGCTIEIKSPRKSGAKVGNSNCSTAEIYNALGLNPNCNIDITFRRLTNSISYSYKGKETSMMLPNYNELQKDDKDKTLLDIINENVIEAKNIKIDGIDVTNILKDIFENNENQATSFLNLMLAINLVRYSISEKFDIFCVDLSEPSMEDTVTFNDLLFIRLKNENHELIKNKDKLVYDIYAQINSAKSKVCCQAVRLSGSNNSCTIQLNKNKKQNNEQ